MKILLLDIETSPNTAYIWRLFKENIGINQIVESSYVMCWAAKWYGEETVMFDSVYHSSMTHMLNGIHKLLDEADVVVHYNGTSFDIPTLNKEFIMHGFSPPAPYKQADLMLVAKDKFRFLSNKMNYVAKALRIGQKKDTTFELWVACMNNDAEAWAQMKDYNIQDVLVLEKLYDKFKPWMTKHPNRALIEGTRTACPNCGSTHYHSRGHYYTTVGKFRRYQCQDKDCRNWFRDGENLMKKTKEIMRNVV